MACFAAISVSQGSVVTYARCCGLFNMHLTANLPRKLPVKKNCRPKSVKIWQNYGHESVAQFFWPTLYKRKGDRSICDNHRGISLLSIPGIILARVMLSRLAKHVKDCDILPESQWGISQWSRHNGHDFHSCKSSAMNKQCDLYAVFVDLTKAFDAVNKDALWKILKKIVCPIATLLTSYGYSTMGRRSVSSKLWFGLVWVEFNAPHNTI